jgi:hypothetical protein
MNAKTMIRSVLLGVIAIAVGGWALKEFGPAKGVATDSGSQATAEAARPDGVTVINFHGSKRCRTCIGIGNQARRILDEEFAAEETAGKIHWEHINYDEPANAHYVKDYELVSSTILATLWKDGKEVTWNRLDGVWDHTGDEPAFRAYVSRSVRELLNQP